MDDNKIQEMVQKLYSQVVEKGDSKAFEVLRDTKGEKPTDKQEIQGTQTLDININVVE